MKQFLIVFLILLTLGYVLLAEVPQIEQVFVYELAKVTFFLISLFDASVMIKPSASLANTLAIGHDGGFFITITPSCSAMMAVVLLTAAIVAFSFSVKEKFIYLLAGVVLLQLVNVLRLISLVYIGDLYTLTTFNFVHENVWPLLIYLFAYLIFFGAIALHHRKTSADQ